MDRQRLSQTIFCFFLFATLAAQSPGPEWTFKKTAHGMNIYTKDLPNTNIKALKFTMEVEASVDAVMELLLDIGAYQQWVYKCSFSENVEAKTPFVTYDYYQIDFPWPFSDRDLYTYSETTMNNQTGVITSYTISAPEHGPEREDFVRVTQHMNKWVITPVGPNKTHLDYTLNSDPAGNIPDWIVNLAADQGPTKSMVAFSKLVKKQPYAGQTDWLSERQ